jgi:DNA helicase-2/ATP-dependent DNA helicase PcrA
MEHYLKNLNEKQREAVLEKDGPILIVAGAGAGKTKTITHRIFHLIKSGVAPANILAITFTNKAAREMRERVTALMGSETKRVDMPFVSTFHALGVHIIKQNAQLLGLPRFFSIYDKSDGKRIVKDALIHFNHDPKQVDPAKIQNIISREKSNYVTAEQYENRIGNEYFGKIVAQVWGFYEKTLKKEHALDLDDLILVSAKLLSENEKVRNYYQELWKYIHIDEYQDTNTVQYQIAQMLAKKHKNICVVGDTDQNIYSWRGADIKNMLRFEKDYPDTKIVLLEENYRSTKTILAVANKIIKKNSLRIEKNLFTQNENGEKIGLFNGFSEIQEAEFIANKTLELLKKGVSENEIAILYRANFQSRILEEAFLAKGLPYTMIGTKFFERKEVKDMLSFLRSALNPKSVADLKRIINVPPRGIGPKTIEKVLSGEKLPAGLVAKKIEIFFAFLAKIREMIQVEKPSLVIKFILKESGVEELLKRGDDEDKERLENIMELVTLATKYDGYPPEEGIERLISDAALASEEEMGNETDEKKKANSGVRLMTVHASKGLEFDYVFIAGLEQDLFPHRKMSREVISANEEEEERRLFYVALTRARKKIFLSYAETRTIFGERNSSVPSEFIFDIGEEDVERELMGEDFDGYNDGRKKIQYIQF